VLLVLLVLLDPLGLLVLTEQLPRPHLELLELLVLLVKTV